MQVFSQLFSLPKGSQFSVESNGETFFYSNKSLSSHFLFRINLKSSLQLMTTNMSVCVYDVQKKLYDENKNYW